MPGKLTMRPSILALLMASAAAYLAMALAGGETGDEAVVQARTRTTAAHAGGERGAPALPELAEPVRDSIEESPQGDLFAAVSWLPPAPPPPPPRAAPPPPPPTAPPLPYRFVGMLEDRSKPTAFLARGDALLIVTAGEVLDGNYRVEKLTSSEITLTYLPLNQLQSIRISGEM